MAIHPAVALTGELGDGERLAAALFAVTTLKSLRPLGEALVMEMGGEPVWVEEGPTGVCRLRWVPSATVLRGAQGGLPRAGRLRHTSPCPCARAARPHRAREDALRTGSVARDPGVYAAPVVDRPSDGPEPLEDDQ